jgi:hypothetical protein
MWNCDFHPSAVTFDFCESIAPECRPNSRRISANLPPTRSCWMCQRDANRAESKGLSGGQLVHTMTATCEVAHQAPQLANTVMYWACSADWNKAFAASSSYFSASFPHSFSFTNTFYCVILSHPFRLLPEISVQCLVSEKSRVLFSPWSWLSRPSRSVVSHRPEATEFSLIRQYFFVNILLKV